MPGSVFSSSAFLFEAFSLAFFGGTFGSEAARRALVLINSSVGGRPVLGVLGGVAGAGVRTGAGVRAGAGARIGAALGVSGAGNDGVAGVANDGVAGVGVATLGIAGAIVVEAVEAANAGVAGVANDGVAGVGNPGVAGVGVATLGVAGAPSSSCSMSCSPSDSSLALVKSELDEELADKPTGAGIVKLGREKCKSRDA